MFSLTQIRTSRAWSVLAVLGIMALAQLFAVPVIDPRYRFRLPREQLVMQPRDDRRDARKKRKMERPSWRR